MRGHEDFDFHTVVAFGTTPTELAMEMRDLNAKGCTERPGAGVQKAPDRYFTYMEAPPSFFDR